MSNIHPTAIVSPAAALADDVEIGPYAVIEGPVKIGSGCRIFPFVHITGHTEIGNHCSFFTGAVVGSIPQDLKFRGEPTCLKIGDYNTFREYVTINPGTGRGESTVIGNRNLLMAYSHVGHNCVIGDDVIIANAGTLAGHVTIEDFAIIGGLAGIHQFCRVGRHAILGGCSKVTQDILPFVTADGHPACVAGINKVGLKRRNFPPETIRTLEHAYRIVFRSGHTLTRAIQELQSLDDCPEIRSVVVFLKSARRGIARERGAPHGTD